MNPSSKLTAREWAPIILRIGISLVFLWFGSQQLMNPEGWTRFFPDFVVNMAPWSAITLVYINGAAEIILGLLLISGLFIRVVAILLAIHMLSIALSLGWSPTGIRDFGLTIATITIALNGVDRASLDMRRLKKRNA